MSANHGHHRGLAVRFGLALCAGTAIILAAGTYASLRMQRAHLTDMVEDRATEVAEVIRSSTREAMMRNDPGEVRQIIQAIADNEGFERIRVFDARGKITVSTAEDEVGALVDQNAEQCVQCHRAGRPLAKVDRADRTRMFRLASGERVLGVIAPLHNEASCSNADRSCPSGEHECARGARRTAPVGRRGRRSRRLAAPARADHRHRLARAARAGVVAHLADGVAPGRRPDPRRAADFRRGLFGAPLRRRPRRNRHADRRVERDDRPARSRAA